jgi:hypothetical protein
MKKTTIGIVIALIALAVIPVALAKQNEKTRIDESCNFEYDEECVLEMPIYEKTKLWNIEDNDSIYDFYFIGMNKDKPMMLLVDGDTDQVKFLNILEIYSYWKLDNGFNTQIYVDAILYNDVDNVLYIVFTKEIK